MLSKITSVDDIMVLVTAPESILLDCTAVGRGIDNHRADVEISEAFTVRVKASIEQNLRLLVAREGVVSGNSESIIEIRDIYTDIMKTTLHRSKTDLSPDQIQVLQFAPVKYVIQEVRDSLSQYGEQLDHSLSEQKLSGSRSLMVSQERRAWFRKHSNDFTFRLTRLYLKAFQREDNNQLRALRTRSLGGDFTNATSILYNPILFGADPKDPLLLLDCYAVWPGNGQEFDKFNTKLETDFANYFPNEVFTPLRERRRAVQTELYDELGGLLAVQSLLGSSEDQQEMVHEEFSWLDSPENIQLLFQEKAHERVLDDTKGNLGFFARLALKRNLKKLCQAIRSINKSLDSKTVRLMLASYVLRDKLQQSDMELINLDEAINIVAKISSRKIEDLIDQTKDGAAVLQVKLAECQVSFAEQIRNDEYGLFLRLLTDYARYRSHLKYYRFAHRVFNRLNLLADEDDIRLAKSGGNLHQLMTSEELKVVGEFGESEIVHHTILKADVRGSTTVTSELIKQGLNPASYFSLRFFDPIRERLATYGAAKVFIEGDALILGLYEYGNSPNEWFSVCRACGLAKEMLEIINSKNTHSRRTGLPSLEIGIGICFSNDRPLFLFDDDSPIMISSAIGDADRMSSCSWRLREHYDSGNFNVGVLQVTDEAERQDDKGQQFIRYNVNGIVIDKAAFTKLSQEVRLKRVRVKLGESGEEFYIGQYPDVQGKERDLVVRAGKVGVWQDGKLDLETDTELLFYEVLPNNMFASKVVELAKKSQPD